MREPYQRLLLEGVGDGLNEMQVVQEQTVEILRLLEDWTKQASTGRAVLEQAVARMRDDLLQAFIRKTGQTRATIVAEMERVVRLLREELSHLRLELLLHLLLLGLVILHRSRRPYACPKVILSI